MCQGGFDRLSELSWSDCHHGSGTLLEALIGQDRFFMMLKNSID